MTLITWSVMQRHILKVTQSLGTLNRTDMLSTIFGCKYLDGMLLACMKQDPQNCSRSPSIRKTIHYNKKRTCLKYLKTGVTHKSTCHDMFLRWRGGETWKIPEPDTIGRIQEYKEQCDRTNVRKM